METITIPKAEYELLKSQEQIYRLIASDFFKTIGDDNLKNLISEFKDTNLYTNDFLLDLENGLAKSTYFKSNNQIL
jgi:hypothetical protein